jgi:hypothetical protein
MPCHVPTITIQVEYLLLPSLATPRLDCFVFRLDYERVDDIGLIKTLVQAQSIEQRVAIVGEHQVVPIGIRSRRPVGARAEQPHFADAWVGRHQFVDVLLRHLMRFVTMKAINTDTTAMNNHARHVMPVVGSGSMLGGVVGCSMPPPSV